MLTAYSQRHIKQRILGNLSDEDRASYRLFAVVNATIFAVLILLTLIVLSIADLDPQLANELAISDRPAAVTAAIAQNTSDPRR